MSSVIRQGAGSNPVGAIHKRDGARRRGPGGRLHRRRQHDRLTKRRGICSGSNANRSRRRIYGLREGRGSAAREIGIATILRRDAMGTSAQRRNGELRASVGIRRGTHHGRAVKEADRTGRPAPKLQLHGCRQRDRLAIGGRIHIDRHAAERGILANCQRLRGRRSAGEKVGVATVLHSDGMSSRQQARSRVLRASAAHGSGAEERRAIIEAEGTGFRKTGRAGKSAADGYRSAVERGIRRQKCGRTRGGLVDRLRQTGRGTAALEIGISRVRRC